MALYAQEPAWSAWLNPARRYCFDTQPGRCHSARAMVHKETHVGGSGLVGHRTWTAWVGEACEPVAAMPAVTT